MPPAGSSAAVASDTPANCWIGGFSREFCCGEEHGPGGNKVCWDDIFSYDPCCLRPDPSLEPEHQVESSDSGAVATLEYMVGPKLDEIAASSNGSLAEFEEGLRKAVESPEGRSVSERTARAFLAVLLHRQGRVAEAAAELRGFHDAGLSISSNGAWMGTSAAGYHMHDGPFADALAKLFRDQEARTIADFGCGLGLYVRDLRAAGFRVGGFDGNPATSQITAGRCLQADLSAELDLGTRWDWLLSLEVAEHIPREFEDVFIRNLERHTRMGIVISWANQPGEGHVNLRPREEVKALFTAYGFHSVEASAAHLRSVATLPWLQETVLVFERDRAVSEDGLVHAYASL
eukprot:gnl/TRDRNA2_/TRDRNA2_186560_c0_seq1.p1 gnl/TRDRNA2_/TRDRNA2_186560_c0~~gnl/TRDRNA2_/TRDRNA2_186560_c0_seq1.p1  ORF type:complete len:378 (+),score=54.74 gnl/TRDRNA2_/TRDRNA2_186560_c0_seq1:96-1136(+)